MPRGERPPRPSATYRGRFGRGGDALPGWGALPSAALATGVLAGFLELAVFSIRTRALGRVDSMSLHISRHASWMIPAAEVLVVLPLALLLAGPWLIGARRLDSERAAGRACRVIGTILGTLLVVGPLLAIRGLAPWAAVLLAVGVGVQSGRFLVRPRPEWSRRARRAGLLAGIVLVVYVGMMYRRAADAPERAWAVAAPPKGAANLLWIVLDTVRADRLSLYGYDRPTTPELERWARLGVTFDEARSPATWTLPSHISMFTGLWPSGHGARVDRSYGGPWPTVADHLGARGYVTGGFTANTSMTNACYGVGRGFDTYVEFPFNHEVRADLVLYNSAIGRVALTALDKLGLPIDLKFLYPHARPAAEMLGRTREWIDRAAAQPGGPRPFFAFVNLMDAHSPYLPRPDRPRVFSGDRPALNRREAMPRTGWEALRAADSADDAHRSELRGRAEEIRRLLGDLYDDCLLGLDDALGRFLDDLRDDGLLANTWVVITSDHGEYLGEHGLFGHGVGLHDPANRVPLVLIPPVPAMPEPDDPLQAWRGLRVGGAVTLCDLPATVMERLAPGEPHPFPGRDLARFAFATADGRDPVLCEMLSQPLAGDEVKADLVRTNSAVYAEGHVLMEARGGPTELFDLDDDPGQLRNLADDPAHRGRIGRLRRAHAAALDRPFP